MIELGGQTLTFVEITEGPPDRNGEPTEIRVDTPVPGCLFRPLRFDEKAGVTTELATEIWKATCPPVAAVLAAVANGEVKHEGTTYQIYGGVQPMRGLDGQVDHVVVMARLQI